MTEEKLVPELRFPEFSGEWQSDKISKISKINPSRVIPNEFYYVDLESVNKGILNKPLLKYNIKSAPSRAKRTLNKGDILYSTVRPYQNNNLYIDFDLKNSFVASTGFVLIESKINSNFQYYFMYSNNFTMNVLKRCTGTSYPAINTKDLSKILIYFPSSKEQEKVGSFFYKIDKKLKLQKEKIEELKNYKKAMTQRIFDQEIRFKDENGEDYADWEEKQLGGIFEISAGGDIDREGVSEIKDEKYNIPIYANSLKNNGLYGYTDKYKIEGETITVTGRGLLGVAVPRFKKYYPIVRLLVLKPKMNCDVYFFPRL